MPHPCGRCPTFNDLLPTLIHTYITYIILIYAKNEGGLGKGAGGPKTDFRITGVPYDSHD
jgi:hypothetical protein